jgi:hypothetical protein
VRRRDVSCARHDDHHEYDAGLTDDYDDHHAVDGESV